MLIAPKKNQYALRAIFELAKQQGKGPTKVSDIAKAQSIPVRFLEVILNQLKGSGLLEAKRGFYGGYLLVREPDKITVGDIFQFMEGRKASVSCVTCDSESDCPFHGDCVFSKMWNRVKDAVFTVFNETTIQDLIESEKKQTKVI
ncbi:MAG: Rrf2 family transcriptional regulator [Desulfobacterales bacterium]|nr:Rrf2 family transcriptional regulator [Desulfobacterales bacterium]